MFDILGFIRPSANVPIRFWRQVYVTNVFSFFCSGLTIALSLILYFAFGFTQTLPFIITVAGLFLSVTLLNRRSILVGRTIFCLIPVWCTMFVTVYMKLGDVHYSYIIYFDSRFILLSTTILPGIVFRLEERLPLLICMGSTFLSLLLFDPIHELFGVGYFQKGFDVASYNFINYVTLISFAVLIVGVFLFRSVMERSEYKLQKRNKELQQKQIEVAAQHKALLDQQLELEAANELILQQQRELEKYNARLEYMVEEKSQQLLRTNQELVKHNNELLQFSYTVSHNLRGPVARLLGLARIAELSDDQKEKRDLDRLIRKSGEELDTALRDLSQIIDIRNELYRVKEKIFLQDEWDKAISLLSENVKPAYNISVDFSRMPYIFGVKPMVQSIFYNLISNAIKYQSPERLLEVKVVSYVDAANKTVVEISDNGMGIDLENQSKNIFKLYKRFHTHVSGKGLGLYLVKTQVEALGGEISVSSVIEEGTTFRMVFTQPEMVSKQIFYENDSSELYYDAQLNLTVINLKKDIASKEYRETFEMVLKSLKTYKTPGWIADMRHQGVIAEEDQHWFTKQIVPEAVKCGLQRVATIGFKDPMRFRYYTRVKALSQSMGIQLRVFESMEEAIDWMEGFS